MEIPASHLRQSRAPRARSGRSGAPWVRKFGNHVTVRPTDRPSAPQTYQCKITQPTGMTTQMLKFSRLFNLGGNRKATGVL